MDARYDPRAGCRVGKLPGFDTRPSLARLFRFGRLSGSHGTVVLRDHYLEACDAYLSSSSHTHIFVFFHLSTDCLFLPSLDGNIGFMGRKNWAQVRRIRLLVCRPLDDGCWRASIRLTSTIT
jgi:hypothetical protein